MRFNQSFVNIVLYNDQAPSYVTVVGWVALFKKRVLFSLHFDFYPQVWLFILVMLIGRPEATDRAGEKSGRPGLLFMQKIVILLLSG
jgi:hypothetical protein